MVESARWPVFCVCCPPGRRQVLAMVEGSRVIIYGQRHGQRHTAVVDGIAPRVPSEQDEAEVEAHRTA